MQACKLTTHIPANHRLEITLPENFPHGEAEVIVLMKAPAVNEASATNINDLLAWQKTLPSSRYTPEEVEDWINEARNAWGDG
jgi:hypothetical protein